MKTIYLLIFQAFILINVNAREISIFQFNIWQEGTSVKDGFTKIVDVIIASKADVVALSEVRNYKNQDLHKRLIEALAAKGHKFYGEFAGGDAGLISRFPISESFIISDRTDKDRGCIIAYKLTVDSKEIFVASAHLDYRHYSVYLPRGYNGGSPNFKMIDKDGDGNPDPVKDVDEIIKYDQKSVRDECLNEFVEFANKNKNTPVILAGDFNESSHLDWTESTKDLFDHNGVVVPWPNSILLHNNGFTDAFRELYPDPVSHPGMTWPSTAFGKKTTTWTPKADERDRIDFIYYNKNSLRVKDAVLVGPDTYCVKEGIETSKEKFLLKGMPWPSDHKGLLVKFDLE